MSTLCSCWTVRRCVKHRVLPVAEMKCPEQGWIEETFMLKINHSQRFWMVHNKDRLMLSCKWAAVNCTRDQRTDVTTTMLLPPDSQVSHSGKRNNHNFPSYYYQVYQLSCVHHRKIVHQGASFVSHQWNLHVYSKKTCESCFKSFIYKRLFYLSVSDILQNLLMPVCVWQLF